MLTSQQCTFCKKSVVGPCENSMLAATCSQNAPAVAQPVNSASLLGPSAFADVHLKQAAEALVQPVAKLTPEQVEQVKSKLATEEERTIVTNTPRAGETLEQIKARADREWPVKPAPMKTQVAGSHYKDMAIQPLTYAEANEMPFTEASVVKYVSRWKSKNGIEDLKKARDMLDKKIAFEQAKEDQGLREYLRGLFAAV